MSNSRNCSSDDAQIGVGTRPSTSPVRRARRRAGRAAAGLAAAAMIAAPAPALAHDTLTGSTPEDGAAAAEAPEEVELTFSADPQDVGLEVRVTGPDSADVTDGDPEIQGSAVTQELSEAAEAPGDYSVVWRVVSSDGHPIEGAFDYTVEGDGAASEQASDGAPSSEPTTGGSSSDGSQGGSGGASDSGSEADAAGESDTVEDQGAGTAVWLMIGGGIVVIGAVAAALVMMRRMSR